jgi:arylformamidase
MSVTSDKITPDAELERGYNVRLLRDDLDDLMADWGARSARFRATADCRLDLAYGKRARERIDLFRSGVAGAPLLAYIHGGYWQRGDKSAYSFVAKPFVDAGVDVAMLSYNLCPDGDLALLTAQVRAAIAWLWRNAGDLGVSRERISVAGHSAGGHLAAMVLATNWPALGTDLARDLVKSGIPISGLFRLEPLRRTTINDAVGIDDGIARDYSPQFLEPATRAPVLVALGGGETPHFHRQTNEFVAQWKRHDAPIEAFFEPDVDHFDVVNRLADPASGFFKKTLAWLA